MSRSFRRLMWAITALTSLVTSAAAGSTISARDWDAYKASFMGSDGRIVDDGNSGISHSEGQGYGLLLSYLAGERSDFELIWAFTRTQILLRDDGLAIWKWNPAASPHVSDLNNASDGDILIAYALALAGDAWERIDLTEAATGMARAIGKVVVKDDQARIILMPAATGFGAEERSDGPVINLSYLVFEAFPVLARLRPRDRLGKAVSGWASVDRRCAHGGEEITARLAFDPHVAETS